jgi:hypothetical protein
VFGTLRSIEDNRRGSRFATFVSQYGIALTLIGWFPRTTQFEQSLSDNRNCRGGSEDPIPFHASAFEPLSSNSLPWFSGPITTCA